MLPADTFAALPCRKVQAKNFALDGGNRALVKKGFGQDLFWVLTKTFLKGISEPQDLP